MPRLLLLVVLLASLFPTGRVWAQEGMPTSDGGGTLRRSLQTLRAPAPPVVDGRLDDTVWGGAPVAQAFVQTRPSPGAPASQATEARVLYDDQALYVGVRLRDEHPDSIVAQLARRDSDVHSDWFSVSLDSYHDRRTAFTFAVNPRGVKRDLRVHGDGAEDDGWDAVWEVATRVDSLGWTAELRIPLSQLRYNAGGREEVVWGINFSRRIARRDELAHWAPLPPEAAGVVSRYGELRGLERLRPVRRLEVRPYSVARVTRAPGDARDPFHHPTALDGSLGGDLQYGLTSDLTLSATLNPDFGQVEADPSQVNLSAFESYFAEKRPFFLEGAEIFSSMPRLFYSRRIGRAPQGSLPGEATYGDMPEASTILGAAKLTGKTSRGWTVGLLSALTAPAEAPYVDEHGHRAAEMVEPLTHYGVARLSRDFREGRSSLGGILTSAHRRISPGSGLEFLAASAYTGALEGRHRFGGQRYETDLSLFGSYVRGAAAAIDRIQRMPAHYLHRPDADHLEYDPTRTSLAGHAARASFRKIGGGRWRWGVFGWAYSPTFEINDLGFGRMADEVGGSIVVEYQEPRPGRLFRRWDVSGFLMPEWSWGGERTRTVLDLTGSVHLHSQWSVYGWVQRDFATLSTEALRGGPALVIPRTTTGYLSLRSDPRKPLGVRLGGYASTEDGTGGQSLRLSSALAYRPSHKLELSLGPSASWTTDPAQWVGRRTSDAGTHYLLGRLERVTAALTTRMDFTVSPTLSLQLYAQPYLSAGDYSQFKEVRDPRAPTPSGRFHRFDASQLRTGQGGQSSYQVDRDGDGEIDFSFADPDFSFKQIRSNAVLRWEYRPGSTLFVAWSQGRTHTSRDGSLDLDRDLVRLLEAPGTSTLLVKLSYWLGL